MSDRTFTVRTGERLAIFLAVLVTLSVVAPAAVLELGGPNVSPVGTAAADTAKPSGWDGWFGDTGSLTDGQLTADSSTEDVWINRTSSNNETRVGMQYEVSSRSGNSGDANQFQLLEDGSIVAGVEFSGDGIVRAIDGAGRSTTSKQWQGGITYAVEFRNIDWQNDTYEIWIDGDNAGTFSFRTSVSDFDRIQIQADTSSSSTKETVTFSDIRVGGSLFTHDKFSGGSWKSFEDGDTSVTANGWAGWYGNSSSINITEVESSSVGELTANGSDQIINAWSSSGNHTPSNISAQFQVSTDSAGSADDYWFEIFHSGNRVMWVYFSIDSNILTVVDGGSTTDAGIDWHPNITYTIELKNINYTSNTYEVWVSGEKTGSYSFDNAASGIDRLRIRNLDTGTANNKTLYFNDIRFDGSPRNEPSYQTGTIGDGWMGWYGVGDDISQPPNSSIDLDTDSSTETANAYSTGGSINISTVSATIELSLDTETSSDDDRFWIYDSGNQVLGVEFLGTGTIRTIDGTGFSSIGTWSNDTAYDIKYEIDWSNDTYEVFIDGTSQGSYSFEGSHSNFTEVRLHSESNSGGGTKTMSVSSIRAGSCTTNCEITTFVGGLASASSGNTVSGTVENQNGDAVKNATVQVWGVDETLVTTEAGQTPEEAIQEEIQAAKNKTPEEWTMQMESDFHLTGTNGHFASQDTRYVAVHRLTDWKHSAITDSVKNDPSLQSPILSVDAARGETVTLALSVWDPDKFELGNSVSSVSNDLPGEPVEGQIVVETVVATDSVGTIQTTETVRDCGFIGCDWSEIFVEIELTPGFYRVYPKGNEGAAYFIKVGNPVEIIVDDLNNELNQLTGQASDVAQDVSSGLFVKKTTTTDASGSFSIDVGPNIKTVAIQAYKAEGIDVSDPSQLDYQTIVEEYADSFDPSTCTQNSELGSVYLPSAVQTVDPPDSDVTVTVREVSFPSYSNLNSLACKSEERLKQLLNETLTEALSMFQQRLEDIDTGELEKIYNELAALYEQNQELEERVNELLAERTGQDTVEVIVNESDATEEQLRDRIASLEEGISQLRSELEGSVETEVDNSTISQIYSVDGDINADAVTLLLHYSNGTTETVTTDSEYLSVNKRPGLSDQVILEEYPIGETDPATLTTELLVAEEETGAIGRVRDTIRNPHFDNEIPTLDSIAVSSLEPGPDEQVSIDIDPEDPTVFDSITDVTVIGPDGEITTDSVSANGQETGFRTDGAGLYHVKLTFNNTEGDTFVETFRLSAGDFDDARPASVQIRTGSTGRWLLVGDGLEGGTIDVGENGRQIAISAQIAQGDDAPGSVHVYTHGIDTGAETVTTVKLTRGSNGDSIQKQLGVVIHTDQLSEDAVLYREDPTNPLPRDGSNQHGVVDPRSNGTTIQTYTEGDGTVTVVTNTEPGTLEEIFYELRLQGVPLPSFATAGLLVAELASAAPQSALASIGGPVAGLVELLVDTAAPLTAAAGPTEAPA